MKYLIFILFLATASIYPQDCIYNSSFGKFKNASAFDITSAGFIYVTDAGTDEIYKLDTLGNVLKSAGGYGWDEGLFDNPSDIFASPLSVYVCDKNNNRVERFDKDLNYVSQLSTINSDTSAERFGYPLGCVVSPQGDLYILDSENKRIVKFDLFGNFSQNFGGYDAGSYALNNPTKLAVSMNNDIYVVDGKRVLIFDQYGTGINILNSGEVLKGMKIIFSNLTLNTDREILFADLSAKETVLNSLKLEGYDGPVKIISSLIYNRRLYILTPNDILVYNIVK